MKVLAIGFAALIATTGVASAQSVANSNSASGSQSVSGVTIEGSRVPDNTPNAGVVVGSAGNCYPGAGLGVSGPGFGVSLGGGRVDPECNVRAEMAALATLAGNTVALAHACKHDESMRDTLVDLGLCRVIDKKSVGSSDRTIDRQTVSVATPNRGYTFCGKNDEGTFIMRVPRGTSEADRATASKQCGKDFAANGGKNIGH